MRRFLPIALIVLSLNCWGQADAMRREVEFLADTIGNRYPGSAGDLMARKHISQHFSKCGLECSEQPFEIVERIWGEGSLQFLADGLETDFIFGKDFDVAGRSATDTLEAAYVVVAGALPDSLHHLMRDKVVICLQKEPVSGSGPRVISMSDVIRAGGLAMISVLPQGMKPAHKEAKGNRAHLPRPIPVLVISSDSLSSFIPQNVADNMSAGSIYSAPESNRIRIATRHCEKRIQAANIIGLKRGNSGKYIIIGAHYDTCAPDPDTGEFRRGANDNASGVAVIMALAEHLGKTGTNHNILYIAFGGEEKGCLGSQYFVSRMPYSKDDIIEMINIDMAGRMEHNTLNYKQYNSTHITPESLGATYIRLIENEGGLSDHTDFVAAGIPATYFTTGEDSAIHTPSDTSDRLNYDGMTRIVDYLSGYIRKLHEKSLGF